MAGPIMNGSDVAATLIQATPAERARLRRRMRWLAGRPLYAVTKAGVMGGPAADSKSAGSATTTSTTSRVRHRVPQGWAISDIRVFWQNARLSSTGELDGENDIAVNGAIEFGSQNFSLLAGSPVTIKPGRVLESDPALGLQFPAAATLYSRNFVSVASGTFPLGRIGSGNASEGTNGNNGADTTAATGAMPTGGVQLFGPIGITGVPSSMDARAIFITADSIGAGVGEVSGGDADGNSGFIERALSNKVAWATCTRSNYAAALLNTSSRRALALGTQFATSVICELGINDVRAPQSLATLQANQIAVWRLLGSQGTPVIATTLTPNANSTDGWATVAGQALVSTAQDAVRVGYNDWLRAGAPMTAAFAPSTIGTSGVLVAGDEGHPLFGYWEVADLVESGRNSGRWKVDEGARAVSDGAMTAGSTTFTSATANFTAADAGVSIFIPGAGPSGAGLVTQIRSVTNSTTVVLATAAGTTVSGAAVKFGGLTYDGLHPATKGHVVMAAGLSAAVDALP